MLENFEYVRDIGALNLKQKRRFYVFFAHELTISVRSLWSNELLTDSQKVEGMKWINEIMHRLIFRIEDLHQISKPEDDRWTEEDFYETIHHWASQNYELVAGHVAYAIKKSYEKCLQF